MRKAILLALLASLIVSCGNDSGTNPERKLEGSINQIVNDSLAIIQAIQDSIHQIELIEKAKADYQKSTELRKEYIGFKYLYPESADFIQKHGSPVTLKGTDNNYWIVYFPKGDFTVISNKKTDQFINIYAGRFPKLKYDVTGPLSTIIGKKMEYNEYVEIVSSIKYGSSEQLNKGVCINKNCTEYYPKGDFTTVAFMEFNDSGNFVTLKKIAVGKIPDLDEL